MGTCAGERRRHLGRIRPQSRGGQRSQMVRKPGQVRSGTGKAVTLGLRGRGGRGALQVAPHDQRRPLQAPRMGEAPERRRQPHAGFPPPAWFGEIRKIRDSHQPSHQRRTPDGKGEWEALEAGHIGDERPGRASLAPADCGGSDFGRKQSETVGDLSGHIYLIFVFSK